MTLAKAIEILEYHEPSLDENPDIRLALKLGIEAIKYVEDAREITAPYLQRLLPGETKECSRVP